MCDWAAGTIYAIHLRPHGASFAGLSWVFAIFLAIAAINFASNYLQQLAMAKVGQGVLFGLRRDMFAHLQKLSLSFYDKTEVGRIMSRVQGDVGQLQEFMSLVVVTLGDLLSLAGIVAALLLLNLKLGLISMTVLPVFAIVLMVWQPFAIRAYVRVRTSASIVNGALVLGCGQGIAEASDLVHRQETLPLDFHPAAETQCRIVRSHFPRDGEVEDLA